MDSREWEQAEDLLPHLEDDIRKGEFDMNWQMFDYYFAEEPGEFDMKHGASDRLFRSKEHFEPEELFDLVEMEVHEELDPYMDDKTDPLAVLFLEERATILAAVEQCRQVYHERGYEDLVEMETSNEWSLLIIEAIISGNYRGLAI